MNRWVFSIGLATSVLSPGPVHSQSKPPNDVVTILWTERRPFQYTDDDGQIKGVLVEPGTKIFSQAGITAVWKEVPANRVIQEIKYNEVPACAVGWYKTPEREAIAQFSQAMYRDQPLRAIMRASAGIEANVPTKVILENPRIRLLLKQGFSYGPYLDGLISRVDDRRIQRVAGDARNLLQMLRAERADAIFLSQEEVDYFGQRQPDFAAVFKVVTFKDAPASEYRYIMCDRLVSPALMKRINDAIATAMKPK